MGKGNLAIIPARGGSKRIARKNIRSFAGRPIVAWSIAVALESGLFDEVMVSTEDQEIAEVAREAGANVPFMRSNDCADDHTPIADVLREVTNQYAEDGQQFSKLCCLFATAPMMQASDLSDGLALLEGGDFEVVLPVARFAYPIQRSLVRLPDGRTTLLNPEHANTRSQDLPEAYHDAGQWAWVRPDYLTTGRPLLGSETGSLVIDPNRVVDIDTEEDWQSAEWKFERLYEQKSKQPVHDKRVRYAAV
ncbi:MAG: pseudaminic acid cytidylyltransferase [Pseudomonadota bacterium]